MRTGWEASSRIAPNARKAINVKRKGSPCAPGAPREDARL